MPTVQRPIVRCLQETHFNSDGTATALCDDWMHRWGQPQHVTGCPLSYRRIGEDKTGGVAKLLDPRRAADARPWHPKLWSNRVICVDIEKVLWLTFMLQILLPKEKPFFLLVGWPWPSRDFILVGAFNSVQSPNLDRFNGMRTGRPESAQLVPLLNLVELEDARILSAGMNDEDTPDPTDCFTYWTPSTASKIDRFLCFPHVGGDGEMGGGGRALRRVRSSTSVSRSSA